jgi:hypothetical protein
MAFYPIQLRLAVSSRVFQTSSDFTILFWGGEGAALLFFLLLFFSFFSFLWLVQNLSSLGTTLFVPILLLYASILLPESTEMSDFFLATHN